MAVAGYPQAVVADGQMVSTLCHLRGLNAQRLQETLCGGRAADDMHLRVGRRDRYHERRELRLRLPRDRARDKDLSPSTKLLPGSLP